jgi:glycosidase
MEHEERYMDAIYGTHVTDDSRMLNHRARREGSIEPLDPKPGEAVTVRTVTQGAEIRRIMHKPLYLILFALFLAGLLVACGGEELTPTRQPQLASTLTLSPEPTVVPPTATAVPPTATIESSPTPTSAPAQNPDGFPEPSLVVLPGTFQTHLGCTGNWDPACENAALAYEATNDVWVNAFIIPAGNYEYKIALDGSWDRNYGEDALPNGANIPLLLDGETAVCFVYDHKTGIVSHNPVDATTGNDICAGTVADSMNHVPAENNNTSAEPYRQPIFLRGTMNGWDDLDGYQFTLSDDDTYYLTVVLAAGDYEMKIASDDWSAVDIGAAGSSDTVTVDEPLTMGAFGPNLNLVIDVSGSYEFVLNAADARNPILTVRKPEVADSGNANERVLYLRGTMNEWQADDAYLFTRDGNLATLEVTLSAGLYRFKIADENWLAATTFGISHTLPVGVSSDLVVGDAGLDILLALNQSAPLRFTLDLSNMQAPILTIDGEISTNTRRVAANHPEFNNLRIYQIMVESFIDGDPNANYGVGYGNSHHNGDLRGIIDALPYIKSLGVNAIWLTPVFDSEAGGADPRLDATGYFTRNYFDIDPNFGTMDDARELVDTAHELGLYVFFDGVFGHHKGDIPLSPNGNLPEGPNNPVDYPESLEFYKEVATFWINELGIDGWRLDQAYQVPLEAWIEIREAVEEVSAARQAAGEEWGILGYMVAEIWRDNQAEIIDTGYGTVDNVALYSAFDFPTRYAVVRVLAGDEGGISGRPASLLDTALLNNISYPPHAVPNLMLGNHDLVRFGDLLQRADIADVDDPEYWARHKAAFSFLAAYTGPITIYYGEEIGAEVAGFDDRVGSNCISLGFCDDHVARSNGRITNLTPQEEDLKNYLASLMLLREGHPALWNGQSMNLIASDTIFAEYKVDGDDQVIYLLNVAEELEEVEISQDDIGGTVLIDLLSGEQIEAENGAFVINVDALTGIFFSVADNGS